MIINGFDFKTELTTDIINNIGDYLLKNENNFNIIDDIYELFIKYMIGNYDGTIIQNNMINILNNDYIRYNVLKYVLEGSLYHGDNFENFLKTKHDDKELNKGINDFLILERKIKIKNLLKQ